MAVERGQVVFVAGVNGVGKTTLLRTIAGQARHRGGAISLDGIDIGGLATHRRAAAGVAYVPEGSRVFRERTLMENLAIGTFALPISRRERRALCLEVLARFPALEPRADERAGNLSGGQRQMLAIGQALAARPRLLLLDEPAAGLAAPVATQIFAAIRELAATGVCAVVVDHETRAALAIADQVLVLRDGVLEGEDPPLRPKGGGRPSAGTFGRARGRTGVVAPSRAAR
jgi:branched-chain amino acid transport system ATP-binding protein